MAEEREISNKPLFNKKSYLLEAVAKQKGKRSKKKGTKKDKKEKEKEEDKK